jgi:hypothetical protein
MPEGNRLDEVWAAADGTTPASAMSESMLFRTHHG